ncbi:uncharacterized protein LOC117331812 [Pecten maximus]|uniref:uncharacterized protein LOC117331812 n=1 Tax=Pecten maximus TaxID=6579 RepID=UPI0014590878|nr:uncharacterized protein LOC117331812 [Pecten maximus]
MEWIPLALTFVTAVCFHRSQGCTCMTSKDLADYYCDDYTELILRGEVLNSTVVESNYPWADIVSYAFEITSVIKAEGNSSRLVEGKSIVDINANTNEAMCGTRLTLGVEYVIAFGASLHINLCNWKRPVLDLQPSDLELSEDAFFNCAARSCRPTADNSLECCRRARLGEVSCLHYPFCYTELDGEMTHCCAILTDGTVECVDYPGLLLKK